MYNRIKILAMLCHIEHPEIDETLMNLGMIHDVVVKKNEVNIAIFIPVTNMSTTIRSLLIQRIEAPLVSLGLIPTVQFFQMTSDLRDKYILIAKNRWRGNRKQVLSIPSPTSNV